MCWSEACLVLILFCKASEADGVPQKKKKRSEADGNREEAKAHSTRAFVQRKMIKPCKAYY